MPEIGAEQVARSLARVADAQAAVRDAARLEAERIRAERAAEGTPAEQDQRPLTPEGP
ncbi:MAG: hypothetical protein ACRDHD_11425 [Candidatus Limnocylindria bacterium]